MERKLATCSYREFDGEMGVPVGTSIGRNMKMPGIPELNSLKPWGVFKTLSHLPLPEQEKVYHANLDKRMGEIIGGITLLTQEWLSRPEYEGKPLVILCWCDLMKVGLGGCHRRWAAEWFATRMNVAVPELGNHPARRQSPEQPLF